MIPISPGILPNTGHGLNHSFVPRSDQISAVKPMHRGDVKFEKFGLTFYKLSQSHFNLMLSIYTDPYANAMVAPVTLPTRADIQRKLDGFIEQESNNELSCYAVFCNTEQKYIGIAGLTYMDSEKTAIEVNYALRKPFRGKGLGEKLCRACCAYAHENGFREIYGETLSYNGASQRIIRKNGFTPDGIVELGPTNMKDTYLTKFKRVFNGGMETQWPPTESKPTPTDLHPNARDWTDLLRDDSQQRTYPDIAHITRRSTLLGIYGKEGQKKE